jgi:hypothetical protein
MALHQGATVAELRWSLLMCDECGQTWDEKKYHPSDDGPLCCACQMPLVRLHRGTDTIQWWLSALRQA